MEIDTFPLLMSWEIPLNVEAQNKSARRIPARFIASKIIGREFIYKFGRKIKHYYSYNKILESKNYILLDFLNNKLSVCFFQF